MAHIHQMQRDFIGYKQSFIGHCMTCGKHFLIAANGKYISTVSFKNIKVK